MLHCTTNHQAAVAEVKHAADDAERELRALLRRALERGLSLEQAFAHFDVRKGTVCTHTHTST